MKTNFNMKIFTHGDRRAIRTVNDHEISSESDDDKIKPKRKRLLKSSVNLVMRKKKWAPRIARKM